MKNKIFHTQDLCLRTNLRCAKDSARMEINVKKQEEIFREIQEMMGETKEGRIRWSVEVMTTEANPAEEKPVEHEDGLDWTIDECYVCI